MAVSTTAFDDTALLAAWEGSLGRGRPWREVALLAAASGEREEAISMLPVGERDARLLVLRAAAFGRLMDCELQCPACGSRLELRLDAATLAGADPAVSAGTPDGPAPGATLQVGAYEIAVRAPTSDDLSGIVGETDPSVAMVRRCIVSATRGHEAVAVDALPGEVVAAIRDHVAALDPRADLQLDLTCPDCSHAWQAPFDAAAFLLAEVEAHALRLLGEVDALARAYGWNESEVLGLSPARRRRYLAMALA